MKQSESGCYSLLALCDQLRLDHLDVVFATVDRPPRLRAPRQNLVERLNVLHSAIAQTALQPRATFFGIDGDALLPGCAAAQHAREVRAGLTRQLQRLAEDLIADAGAEIDERLGRGCRGAAEEAHRLLTRVGCLPTEGLHPGDKLHIDRHLDLEYIHAVARLRKLLHVRRDVLRLQLGELETLLVAERIIVRQRL